MRRPPSRVATACALALAAASLTVALTAFQREPETAPPGSQSLQDRIGSLRRSDGRSGTTEEVLSRLETLWEWANGLALRGVVLPIDFPLLVYNHSLALKQSLARGDEDPEAIRAAVDFIRRLTEELAAKEGDPAVVGRLELDAAAPYRAGEYVTFEQELTVGPRGIAVGGGLVAFATRAGRVQSRDPAADDFVSVRTSRAGAVLEPSAPWGDWESFVVRGSVAWRLGGEALVPGDTVTLRYGDTSGGSQGLRLQAASNDEVIFPLLVDLEGRGEPWTPAWPSFEVRGRPEVAFVNAVVPSVVAPGQVFELAVRSEDRFKNLASGPTPEYRVLVDDREVRRIAAGSPPLTVLSDLRLERPGVYRFRIVSADGTLEATSNPAWVRDSDEEHIFWGDLHGHCGFAEGQGTPDGYYRFGRDVARLDFLSLSEHDALMDDSEWQALEAAVRAYDAPGRFTALLGYEWTQYNPVGGHHNVYFSDPEGRRRVPVQETLGPEDLYRTLRQENAEEDLLVIPHTHESADWRSSDPSIERLVEIQSGHGTFEYFGNRYLRQGWEVGFVGASDNHGGHPGYTGVTNLQLGGLAGVLAPHNEAPALFEALRERRVYATTGERIILEASLNGEPMGERLPASADRRLDCRVHATAPIETVDVIKNGAVVFSRRYLEEAGAADAGPALAGAGPGHRLLVQLRFESSSEVFTGPRNPRGERIWRGTLEVEGARLETVKLPWYHNPASLSVERSSGEPNRLQLVVPTRGRGKALLLTLADASAQTRLRLRWAGAREAGPRLGATPEMLDRPPADLPPGDLEVSLGVLREGPARHVLQTGLNADAIELRLVPASTPVDGVFEFRETDETPGDYYYVRVTQVDGAMAWSSPWWIGETAP